MSGLPVTETEVNIFMVVFLVLFAGLCSGLTIGLLSISSLELQILNRDPEASAEAKRWGRKLEPLIAPERHHLLLVTLLLANASAAEALPIFLDNLVPSWLAIIFSVTLVLAFGEVLPQAIATQPGRALQLGAWFAPLVRLMMLLLMPIAWPIAKLLDCLLGQEGAQFLSSRSQMMALLDAVHGEQLLQGAETRIMKNVMGMTDRTVRSVVVPWTDTYTVSAERVVNKEFVNEVMEKGHSRMPVHSEGDRHHVLGTLHVKSLVGADLQAGTHVKDYIEDYRPLWVAPQTGLFHMLHVFQTGRSHQAIVSEHLEAIAACINGSREFGTDIVVQGILTLEDVLEALLDAPIFDEFDPVDKRTCFDERTGKGVDVGVESALAGAGDSMMQHGSILVSGADEQSHWLKESEVSSLSSMVKDLCILHASRTAKPTAAAVAGSTLPPSIVGEKAATLSSVATDTSLTVDVTANRDSSTRSPLLSRRHQGRRESSGSSRQGRSNSSDYAGYGSIGSIAAGDTQHSSAKPIFNQRQQTLPPRLEWLQESKGRSLGTNDLYSSPFLSQQRASSSSAGSNRAGSSGAAVESKSTFSRYEVPSYGGSASSLLVIPSPRPLRRRKPFAFPKRASSFAGESPT